MEPLLKPITIETLRDHMKAETVTSSVYAAWFKGIIINISDAYFVKPSDKFLAAVETWAKALGADRRLYDPSKSTSENSEDYCYRLWMEMDGSQTEAAIRSRKQDPVHQQIYEHKLKAWNGLKPDEQKALRHATLYISMIPPARGGFGDTKRWKDLTPTNAFPELLTQAPGKEDRFRVFLQTAREIASDYQTRRAKANPVKPFDPANVNRLFPDPPKLKRGEVGDTGTDIISGGGVPYFPDDRPAMEIMKKQEPKGTTAVPQSLAKSVDAKGPLKGVVKK